VRLGVDVGSVRVGVALSDAEGRLATPVATLARDPSGRTSGDLAALAALAVEHGALEVVIGLPLSLSGAEGLAATASRAYGEALAAGLAASGASVPVRFVDERLTTVSANRAIRASGRTGNARQRRKVIDQAAAVVILQAALDTERATGAPPGEALVRVMPVRAIATDTDGD